MKGKLLKIVLMLVFVVGSTSIINISYAKGSLKVCTGKYALCTSAKCIPNPNAPTKEAICTCQVHTGANTGKSSCEQRKVRVVKDITLLKSTFSPKEFATKKIMTCPDKVAWSDCLDSACTVNPSNPKQAICNCKLKWSQQSYTFGGNCNTKTCKTGYWSAATLEGAQQDNKIMNKYLNLNNNPNDAMCKK